MISSVVLGIAFQSFKAWKMPFRGGGIEPSSRPSLDDSDVLVDDTKLRRECASDEIRESLPSSIVYVNCT